MHYTISQLLRLSSRLPCIQCLFAFYSARQLSTTLFSIITSLLITLNVHADGSEPINQAELEYRIKAAYLFNLSKFIEWPDEAANSTETIDICLIGGNPFSDYIYKLEQRKARGRAIKIIDGPTSDKLNTCEMIFVASKTADAANVLNNQGIGKSLTVGESEVFITQGGLINLAIENGRVQLTINNTMAKKLGFTISANLLEIARLVE